jgi:lipid-A-disaccharide synthase-like uncharacterized protein
MSIVRYPSYAVLLVSVSSIVMTPDRMRVLVRFIGWTAIACSTISIFQYFNFLGLNQAFISLYRDIEIDSYYYSLVLDYGTRRVIGTAGNPNSWGFCLSVIGLLVMARIVFSRHLIWLPHLVLVAMSILLTGSRTATIGFLAGAAVMLGVGVLRGQAKGAAIVAATIAMLTIPVVFWIYTQEVAEGADRFSTRQMGSLMARFEVWTETIKEYSNDLLIGRGPNKAARRLGFANASSYHVRDNIFISVFAQFGLLGISLLIALFWVQWRKLWRLTTSGNPDYQFWTFGMIGGFVSWCLFNLMADAFFALHPTHLFLALYGLTLAVGKASRVPERRAADDALAFTERAHTAAPFPEQGFIRS